MPESVNFVRRTASLWLVLLLAAASLHGCRLHTGEPAASMLRTDGRLEFLCPDDPATAVIRIEIADSPTTRARGLMGRRLKDDTEGMLFIFETPDLRTFWMRNTPGSLDMIFVAEDGWVRNIVERTTPLTEQTYSSVGPASYVVEVPAGFARRLGVDPRCRIRWQRY